MDAFIERVQDRLVAAISRDEYHEVTDGFTIRPTDDGALVAQTSLVVEEPKPLTGDEETASDWESSYEDLTAELDGDLYEEANTYLSRLREAVTFTSDAVTPRETMLLCAEPDAGVSAVFDFYIEQDTIPVSFDSLADAVVADDQSYLDDPERIVEVSVRSPLHDPAESEFDVAMSPDYTILFETDAPHELWKNCETIEDYAEMVAENSDEHTVNDVLDWDTYHNHYHLTGDVEPNDIVTSQTRDVLDAHVDVSHEGLDVDASEFGVSVRDGGRVWVEGSVAGWITALSD